MIKPLGKIRFQKLQRMLILINEECILSATLERKC